VLRRVTGERRVISTAIGMTPSGKIYKRHFDKAIDIDRVITAMELAGRPTECKWILIWGRAKIQVVFRL